MSEAITKALRELMSIVDIHQKATGNRFAWAEMDSATEALSQPAPLAGEVMDALLELVESHEAPYPSEASGIEAQDAWAIRRTDALEKARAILALRQQAVPTDFEKLLRGIGEVTQRAGIYNGEVRLTGPLALHLLNDMANALLSGPQAVPMIPLGFRVSHNPDWCALTDEVNAGSRWTVERNDAPYEGASRKRMWKGRTLADAMAAALADLGITAKAEGEKP